MSASTFVLTWVLQSTVLGVVALLLPGLFRLREPKALATWWQPTAFLVVVLPLLPLLRPRQSVVPGAVVTFVEQATAAMGPPLGAVPTVPPLVWLGAVWCTGVIARLGWLIAGQRRLRRLAARGRRVENDPVLDRARSMAPAARIAPLAPSRVPVISVADAGP